MDAIRDGDRNTRYFHVSTIIRRRINRIETLQHNDGHWVTEPNEIKRLVTEYFASLFTESLAQPCNDLPTRRFPRLREDQLADLTQPYSDRDVFLALQSM